MNRPSQKRKSVSCLQQGTEFGIFEQEEQNIMESVFRFGDRRVDAIMTPHTEITWLDLEEEFSESLQKIMESRYTRFPVAKGGLDNVIGVLLTKDLLQNTLHDQQIDLEPMLRPAVFVPESMPAMKVLEKFKETGLSVALVIDEYGGMLGMVTQADVLKSIVGDIPAAGEQYDRASVMRADGSWLMDGLMRVDELKPLLEIDSLPDEERVGYQTLGGFIMSQFDTIPITGQMLEWSNWRFEVVDMDGRRIDKVLVTPLQAEDESDETQPGQRTAFMIPVRLQLKGFLSYLDPVELDFTGLDVACISGSRMGRASLPCWMRSPGRCSVRRAAAMIR